MKAADAIELLKIFMELMTKTDAKKRNIEVLNCLIEALQPLAELEIKRIPTLIEKSKKPKKEIKEKAIKYSESDFIELAKLLNRGKSKELLTEEEQRNIDRFIVTYPKVANIVNSNVNDLYNALYSIAPSDWTISELRFLLYFFFNIRITSKKKKKEIFDIITNTAYQYNYSRSLDKNNFET
ncbi:hypothetical protein [Desulfosporosinus hippei]|uniref:Uncharacterized protein n=1 Tax=Desulfosporosinus hippei DSM 8344 TaxID=1121419 RepID=A0A1G8L3P6_9FIRM|nr:hypothetical protein [Desulfosporosinus hippei]SDI50278.1 hypothetical protein SAMN05443529_14414 [Desulfosporosinus hippei DSM 8344]